MLKRLRQGPALRGRRLVERAGLLLEERQIMLRIEDELAAIIDTGMAGDFIRAADDRHLIDKTFHQNVTKAIGGGHGIIVHAIAHESRRGDFGGALVAGLEWRFGQSAELSSRGYTYGNDFVPHDAKVKELGTG